MKTSGLRVVGFFALTLCAIACSGDARYHGASDDAPASNQENAMTTAASPVKADTSLPLIDRELPARIETATFALG